LQEVVDIVAIANSLRAMRGGRDELADFAVLQDSTAEARPQAGADRSVDPAGRRCPRRQLADITAAARRVAGDPGGESLMMVMAARVHRLERLVHRPGLPRAAGVSGHGLSSLPLTRCHRRS